MTSVPPVWADFLKTIVVISGSETASMMPRRYSALDVLHFPGSALASGERTLYWSAHSEIDRSGGGCRTIAAARRLLINPTDESVKVEVAELRECLPPKTPEELFPGRISRHCFQERDGLPRNRLDASTERSEGL